ncbi:uncharacterized protein LOC110901626 [Helianthus annuus]|uniref:uncharacterized protein LOC110901626 n=1 Tax=Helianthus annuus TaxID=4232 RepID=UPI000B8F3255|nr:uncharacterized protein LOC110901626 [Helianthus annuus]
MASGSNNTTTASKKSCSSGDPSRKYGTQNPKVRANITCNFCGKMCKGGVYHLKQHLVGGFTCVVKCTKCPEHVREKMRDFIQKKEMSKVESVMNSKIYADVYDLDEEEEDEEVTGSGKASQAKKPRVRGVINMFYGTIQSEKQKNINAVYRKELRNKACKEVARWFYDAGLPFNASNYDSFRKVVEAIGQFGPGMKPPTMYELRVSFLQDEVKEVDLLINEHKKEWKVKGCSILSDGWRDSVVQKEIINFVVNSPKGSVFIKSLDVSEVTLNADFLFKLLDAMVEEIGEKNVVQVVTDNAAAYVKAVFVIYNL